MGSRVARAACLLVASAALSLATAGPAAASISDGAVDDNSDPVLLVSCDLVELPDGSTQEMCFEAHKGGGAGPTIAGRPTRSAEPEPTQGPEPTQDTGSTAEVVAPTEEASAKSGTSSTSGTAAAVPTSVSTGAGESAGAEESRGADGGGAAQADPSTAPVRVLPNTGPGDFDGGLFALGLGCVAAGGLLVRRSRLV